MTEVVRLYLGDLQKPLLDAANKNGTTLSKEIRRRLRESFETPKPATAKEETK